MFLAPEYLDVESWVGTLSDFSLNQSCRLMDNVTHCFSHGGDIRIRSPEHCARDAPHIAALV